ncbi:sigma-70 family RNA polymerase sigma factor [Kitasatospora sp. NPDC005856]|uniref:RNA polymerase sigma factor n=1 Tax=Kitasatospora sp. NPDC005856 TaxID=3154566 RepID=UPI0033CE1614
MNEEPRDACGATPAMSFEQAYGLYHAQLVRSVCRQAAALGLSDRDADAEAVVQDTFEEALRVWDTVRTPRAWLHTVARRRVARCVPQAMHRAHGDPAEHAGLGAVRWSPAAPAAGAEDFVAAREVAAVIRRMPRRRRQVAYLRYLMEWDYTEIAEQLGCRPSTARVHALKARADITGTRLLDKARAVADDDRGETTTGFLLVTAALAGALAVGRLAGWPWAPAAAAGGLLTLALAERAAAALRRRRRRQRRPRP